MAGFFDHRDGARATRSPARNGPIRSRVDVAALFCIVLGISCTAIAVWSLEGGDDSGRLTAAPWSCCLANP